MGKATRAAKKANALPFIYSAKPTNSSITKSPTFLLVKPLQGTKGQLGTGSHNFKANESNKNSFDSHRFTLMPVHIGSQKIFRRFSPGPFLTGKEKKNSPGKIVGQKILN
jgi:hypothetical protein